MLSLRATSGSAAVQNWIASRSLAMTIFIEMTSAPFSLFLNAQAYPHQAVPYPQSLRRSSCRFPVRVIAPTFHVSHLRLVAIVRSVPTPPACRHTDQYDDRRCFYPAALRG